MMLLTVKEVSKNLHVNANYVYKLINSGLLPAMKIGSMKVREETLMEFLEKYDGQDVDQVLQGGAEDINKK